MSATIASDPSAGNVGAALPGEGPGRFSLTGLPPVPLHLRVALPPDNAYVASSADLSGASGALGIDGGASTTGLTITLRRAAAITGTVRDDAGTPVAGADVRLMGCLPACPPHATTDALGRYRLADVARDSLPTRWVTDSGIPSGPTIRLAPGEENRSVEAVMLAEPDPPSGWPGLAQGFLARPDWVDRPSADDEES